MIIRITKSSVFVLLACVCGLAAAAPSSQPQGAAPDGARRPNVVILFPDQLRWCEVGCYGNPVIRTPNIDRLAAEGARFTQAFTNFPVCSPARSILLSGRYARSNGVVQNQDEEALEGRPTNRDTTIAEVLERAGYRTALVGKWHLRPTPSTLGFAESTRCRMRHRYYKQTYYRNEGEPYVCEDYSPHHETQAAVRFIRENRERPFFLFLAYGPPHMPVSEMPERYQSMYDPAQVVLRPNVWRDGKLAYNERWFKIYMWDFQYYSHADTFSGRLPEGMDLRDLTALYYGQTTAVDDCVGQVMEAVASAGLADDTILVLTSDHGDLLGSHGLFNKNRHYEEAIRVPMIVRWPRRIRPATIDKQLAGLVDVAPTLLDLCGAAVPPSVQGTSLASVLAGSESTVGENAAYIETGTEDGVRTDRYTYSIERGESRAEHLFDCQADPYQLRDLAGNPAHAELLEQLRGRVEAWRTRTPAAGT